jgi:hypothetical protein
VLFGTPTTRPAAPSARRQRSRPVAGDVGLARADVRGTGSVLHNVFFDTCVHHQLGIDLLFGSEMIGADPQTGHPFDHTRRYVDARRVYPRLARAHRPTTAPRTPSTRSPGWTAGGVGHKPLPAIRGRCNVGVTRVPGSVEFRTGGTARDPSAPADG